MLKASEDKTFPGAIVASLASPWGQAVNAGTLVGGKAGVLRVVPRGVLPGPVRDLHRPARRRRPAPRRGTRCGSCSTDSSSPTAGSRATRWSTARSAPDTGGDQLDETAYPILMAYQSGLSGDTTLWQRHIRPAADFLVAHGPSFGVERWEEQSGYSPSTIAAEIAGLSAASSIAAMHGDTDARQALPGDGRRLPAQHQELDGHDDRPGRAALLHPAVQDRRPERRDHLRPRQRRPDRGPALGRRRRLPGTGAARRTARRRPRRDGVACGAGQADLGGHAERHRLLPLRHVGGGGQRGRLRRLLPAEPDLVHGPGPAVADHGHRHRAPVAGVVR